jgi:hypothetical protein
MGFGGGAMIGGPLASQLMAHYKAAGQPSIPYTMITMGLIYFVFMMFGVFTIRVPREGWKPAGWTAPAKQSALISTHNVAVSQAWRAPQFWLLWVILFTNVTAGIGILEQAAPMIQDLFKGSIGPAAAVGFVGLLSIFNMALGSSGRRPQTSSGERQRTSASSPWERCCILSFRQRAKTGGTRFPCLLGSP